MNAANGQPRRATIEDLPQLALLWEREQFDIAELERRFKEFQVVEDPDGAVAGSVGLRVEGVEGLLHSEVYVRHEQADALRQLFWERAQVIAKNHGLVRLWSQFSTPFWNHCGLRVASTEEVAKVPGVFGAQGLPWRFIQLREEAAAPLSIDKELALFKAMERERTERVFRQARMLKILAGVVVVIVAGVFAVGIMAWYKTRRGPR